MLRRHFLALALSTGLLAGGFSASAQAQMAPAVDQPVTITFYNYNLASAGIGREATLDLIARFEAANPNIKVDPIGAPSNEVLSRVQADMVAGSWGPSSQNITLSTPLATGVHALQTRLMDPAGNVGSPSTASVSVTIDTSAPSSLASQSVTLLASDDSGVSSSDGLTNVTLPTVNVSNLSAVVMAVGDVIEIIDTSSSSAVVALYTLQASDLDSNTGLPVWSDRNITLTTALSSGQHVLAARLADLAGNPGVNSSTIAVNIDTANPSSLSAAILDLASSSDSGTTSSDNITSAISPQMSVGGLGTVTMKAGDRIQIVDTSNANAVVGSYTVLSSDLSGSSQFKWASKDITLSTSLAHGVHALAARLMDAAC